MRNLFFVLGFILATAGGIGTFTSKQFMENHPELQMKTTLADFFGQTQQLSLEAKAHLFFNDYGIAVTLLGAAFLVLAFICPISRGSRR